MSHYRFTEEQRVALWHVHQHRCRYCEEPLGIRDTVIDHIIPERLLDKAEEYARVKQEYGLGPDFEINDYPNWFPVHARCNLLKGGCLFPVIKAAFILEIAARKGTEARQKERELRRTQKGGSLLGKLGIYMEQDILTEFEVYEYLRSMPLTVAVAAKRMGVCIEAPGGPNQQPHKLAPRGSITLLLSDHRLTLDDAAKLLPDSWSKVPIDLDGLRFYIMRMRKCFVQALVRDSYRVMVLEDPEKPHWDNSNAKALVQGVLTPAFQGDAHANGAIDHALCVIGDRDSWDPNCVVSGTGEGNQALLPDAMKRALTPILTYWWETSRVQEQRQCLAYRCGTMWHVRRKDDMLRCDKVAQAGGIFCQKHQPRVFSGPITPLLNGMQLPR